MEKFNHGEFIAFSTAVWTIAPEENYSRLGLVLSLELELGGKFSSWAILVEPITCFLQASASDN